jgi:hypothetical protein
VSESHFWAKFIKSVNNLDKEIPLKKIILATGALLISMSAFADTASEKTAKEMTAVLQSHEVQALLSQEDGVGNIQGIKYLFSYRTVIGPAIYELSFESYSGSVAQICTVPVQVNIQTTKVIKIDSAVCKEIK